MKTQMNDFFKEKVIIISGHYGAGKTNVAVNIATDLSESEKESSVSLVDLDIVNPYFRAADNVSYLESHNVKAIIPPYANSNVDIPSLPGEVFSVFDGEGKTILDVGGDADGASALGFLREKIKEAGYEMYYVYNYYRPTASAPEDSLEIINEISAMCGLSFCGIINNSNLGVETTSQTIEKSFDALSKLERISGLKTVMTTVERRLKPFYTGKDTFYIENVTKKLY